MIDKKIFVIILKMSPFFIVLTLLYSLVWGQVSFSNDKLDTEIQNNVSPLLAEPPNVYLSKEQYLVLKMAVDQINKKIEGSESLRATLFLVQGLKVIQTIAKANEVKLEKIRSSLLYSPIDIVENASGTNYLDSLSGGALLVNPPRPCVHKLQ